MFSTLVYCNILEVIGLGASQVCVDQCGFICYARGQQSFPWGIFNERERVGSAAVHIWVVVHN